MMDGFAGSGGAVIRTVGPDATAFAGLTFKGLAPSLAALPEGWLALGARVEDEPAGLALGRMLPMPGRVVHGAPNGAPDGGTEGYLLSVAVAPAHRRRGIGRALLAAFETAARARGAARLRAVHTDFLPARAAFEALLAASGWGAPRLLSLRYYAEARVVRDHGLSERGLMRRVFRSDLHRCDPWTNPGPADLAAVARLLAQPSYHPGMDFHRHAAGAHPEVSCWLRRGGETVGWVIGAPSTRRFAGRPVVYYASAYLDEALWHTALTIAGYCHVSAGQAVAFGEDSVLMADTPMPRQQAMLRGRFAPTAMRLEDTYETSKPLAAGGG
jgi:GNAT superfamily N-acetyltransferase